jgi:hypothetical protein
VKGICGGISPSPAGAIFAIFASLSTNAWGRSGVIAPNFGMQIEKVKMCLKPESRTDRGVTSWKIRLARFPYLVALFLYLEMPEQVGRTQGAGNYCRKVSRWVLCTGKAEIRSIFELPLGFSVEIAVAGAKNGYFWTEMQGSFYQRVVVWCSHANRG